MPEGVSRRFGEGIREHARDEALRHNVNGFTCQLGSTLQLGEEIARNPDAHQHDSDS
jgi:hypothetical protein